MTKEEAEALLIGLRVRGERLDTSSEDGRVHAESIKCALTLARAGAAVMFPGEEDVERVARAIDDAEFDDVNNELAVNYTEVARAAIAAMKPMEVDRA